MNGCIPLVGASLWACKRLFEVTNDSIFSFPEYCSEEGANANPAIGAGLRLMNIDSHMCDYVIADFVLTDTPILAVHDSFIVPIGEEDRLNKLVKKAFNEVT